MTESGTEIRKSAALFIAALALYTILSPGRFTVNDDWEIFFTADRLARGESIGFAEPPSCVVLTPGRDGLKYGWHSFAQTAYAAPLAGLTRALGWFGAPYLRELLPVLLNALLAAAALTLFWNLSRRLYPENLQGCRWALGFLAFSPFTLYYATTFFSEMAQFCFVLGICWSITRYRQTGALVFMALAAACLAHLVWIKLANGVFILPALLAAVVAANERRAPAAPPCALLCAGIALALIATGAVNWLKFGSFSNSGYPLFLAGGALHSFTHPVSHGLWLYFFSPGKSLFAAAPAALIVLAAMPAFLRRHQAEGAFALTSLIVCVGLYSSWVLPEAGYCYGPRFAFPFLALCHLALPAVLGDVAGGAVWTRRIWRPLACALAVAQGFLFIVHSLVFMPNLDARFGDYYRWDRYAITYNDDYSPHRHALLEITRQARMMARGNTFSTPDAPAKIGAAIDMTADGVPALSPVYLWAAGHRRLAAGWAIGWAIALIIAVWTLAGLRAVALGSLVALSSVGLLLLWGAAHPLKSMVLVVADRTDRLPAVAAAAGLTVSDLDVRAYSSDPALAMRAMIPAADLRELGIQFADGVDEPPAVSSVEPIRAPFFLVVRSEDPAAVKRAVAAARRADPRVVVAAVSLLPEKLDPLRFPRVKVAFDHAVAPSDLKLRQSAIGPTLLHAAGVSPSVLHNEGQSFLSVVEGGPRLPGYIAYLDRTGAGWRLNVAEGERLYRRSESGEDAVYAYREGPGELTPDAGPPRRLIQFRALAANSLIRSGASAALPDSAWIPAALESWQAFHKRDYWED